MNETITDPADDERKPIEYINHLLFIVEGTWMVIGNGLIIVTLLCHKTMKKQQMATMVALAIPDGLYGVGIFYGGVRRFYLVMTRTDRLPMSAWECMLTFPTLIYVIGSQMTALAMVLISVDRYIVVAHTAWHLRIDEKQYARRMIWSVIWFGVATGAVAVGGSYFGWGDDSTHEAKWSALCLSTWAVPSWYATGYTTLVAVGGYTSIVIYIMVLRAYRKYAHSQPEDNSNLAKIKMERERRITITMAFVTLMTLFFHSIPYTIILTTTLLKLKGGFVSLLNPFLWCLVCGNSLANIFIYLKRHNDMRAAMNDVIRGRFKPIAVQPTGFSLRVATITQAAPKEQGA